MLTFDVVKRPVKNTSIILVIDGFGQGGIQQAYRILFEEYCKTFGNDYLIIIRTSTVEIEIPYIENLSIIRLNSKNLTDIFNFYKFNRIIHQIKPDFIIASIYRSQIWAALSKSKYTKLIWIEHNTYLSRTKSQWNLMKVLSNKVDKIVGVSDDVKELTELKLGKPVVTIPNPCTFTSSGHNLYNKSSDFIFVSRMSSQKNPELMLRSFARIVDKLAATSKLHMVGDGNLLDSFKLLSKELNIDSRCVFHGWLKIELVQELMSTSSTLVSTSIIEGMSLVRLEALASGCCVVTTNTGGAHLFDSISRDGFFVVNSDIDAIGQAMLESLKPIYWLNSAVLTRARIVENFNPETIANSLIN